MVLEAVMTPEILLWHHPDVVLEKLVHVFGIFYGIAAGKIGQGRFDHDPEPLPSRQSPDKERDNRRPAGLGQPAQSYVCRCEVPEKRDLGAPFARVALVRGVPDRNIIGQRVEQHPNIIPWDRDLRPPLSSLPHETIQNGVVTRAVERTNRDFPADESGSDLECGEMTCEQECTSAAGQGPLEMLESLDCYGWKPLIGSPPAHGRLDKSHAECPEMSSGESADLTRGFLRETSFQVVSGDRPPSWLQDGVKQSKAGTRNRFTGVGQLTCRIHQSRSCPEGPVPRFPQSRRSVGFLQRSA